MALTEAQKRYQNSDKGRAARQRYMEKKKARLASEKKQKTESKVEKVVAETPKSSLIN